MLIASACPPRPYFLLCRPSPAPLPMPHVYAHERARREPHDGIGSPGASAFYTAAEDFVPESVAASLASDNAADIELYRYALASGAPCWRKRPGAPCLGALH